MINDLLLYGDNPILLDEMLILLNNFTPIQDLNISFVDDISDLSFQANQVLICLCENEQQTCKVLQEIEAKHAAYITSFCNNTIIKNLNDIEIIGNQRHLFQSVTSQVNLNLGTIKDNIGITEPAIRESSLFLLDLNVLRSSEVNNSSFSHPSGLFSEDVSQMCRYAGMTEKNRYFIINNVREDILELVAQLIWYFAEAASIRFPDHPYFTNTVEEYAVQITSFDIMLSFYKSKSSGRWWVKIPITLAKTC